MPRSIAQERDNGRVQLSLFREAIVQFAQFAARGQLAEPEQVAGFFEIGVIGEFVDVDAAISQHAAIAIDITDLGTGGDNSLKSFGSVRCGHAGHQFLAFNEGSGLRSLREGETRAQPFLIPERHTTFQPLEGNDAAVTSRRKTDTAGVHPSFATAFSPEYSKRFFSSLPRSLYVVLHNSSRKEHPQ